uniref:Uncharacterized protein LOC111114549 n=1 Tax=Crassostrea virginica TaxID=6565 RepID=A0A8B8BYY4_CRAVI|nr:uncharacterized protein LOC111114549 [Crassostrea virginica]XP_022308608.1 uncharacterized protein LOC111114549 [Crassostrea virginica]XP_022308609.1 uncharacterized protein LOC111114549 [Crassostrea virginica]
MFQMKAPLLFFLLLVAVQYTEAAKGTEIIGDGNCFYRSLAQYLYENQEEHVGVRRQIIAYMSGGTDCPKEEGEQRRRRYQAMVPGSYDEYLRRHSRFGEYSDDAIVQAAADLFGVNLYINSYGSVQPVQDLGVNSYIDHYRYSYDSGINQRSVAHSIQATSNWLHLRLQGDHFTIEGDWTDSEGEPPQSDRFVDVRELPCHGTEPYEKGIDAVDSSKKDQDTAAIDLGVKKININKALQKAEKDIIKDRQVENLGAGDSAIKIPESLREDLVEIEGIGEETDEQHISKEDEYPDEINEALDQNITEGVHTDKENKGNTQVEKFEPLYSFAHFRDLHHRGQIGPGTICRVTRNYILIYFHYFMIVKVTPTSVDIVHLCSSLSTIRCEQRTVKFNASNDPEFDFSNGVSFCCGGASHLTLNETWIKDFENRIKEMTSMVYIPYSLVNNSKWHCQSLAYYISTGEKKNTEPSDFINRCSVNFLGVTVVSVVSLSVVLYGIIRSSLIFPIKFKSTLKIELKRTQSKMIEKMNKTVNFIIWIIRYPIHFLFFPFFRKL